MDISTDKSKKGHGSNKLSTYNKFKSKCQPEPYLNYPNILKYRSIIAKFRLSAHKLKIETGRYNSRNAYFWNNSLGSTPQLSNANIVYMYVHTHLATYSRIAHLYVSVHAKKCIKMINLETTYSVL
jgi:hypothetical protein